MDSLKEIYSNLIKSFLSILEHKNEQEKNKFTLYKLLFDMVNQVAKNKNYI